MSDLHTILSHTSTDDVDTRIEASNNLAEYCNDTKVASESLDLAIESAISFASDDDKTIQKNGTKALVRILSPTSIVSTLADQPINPGTEKTHLDTISGVVITNLGPSQPATIRSYAALAAARIASKKPGRMSTDTVFDHLDDLLETETRRIRVQRAIHALSNIGTYDAPRKEAARRLISNHIDRVRNILLESSNETSVSKGVKGCGLTALSFPAEILPAEQLQKVVTDSTARPKTRNRAIRALWQLGRTYPGIAVSVQPTQIGLLSYTSEDAEDSVKDSDDNSDYAKLSGFVRSNTAKTFATIAKQQPEGVDPSVVSILTDLIETRDRAIHRSILAIGELVETYPDEVIEAEAPDIIQTYLEDEQTDKTSSPRHCKARGYAVWTLLRVVEHTDCEFAITPADHFEYLLDVPGTERTQFDHRRTEALRLLVEREPSIIANESICEYLWTRVESSPDPTERRQAGRAFVIGSEQQTDLRSNLTADSVVNILETETDQAVCTMGLALLDTFETDTTTAVHSIIKSKDPPMNQLWTNLRNMAIDSSLVCPNCGYIYATDQLSEGALCEQCNDGYISGTGDPLEFP